MLHVFALSFEGSVDLLWSLSLALEIAFNKHDLVTWYKITQAAGIQVAQWDFQNKATRTSPPWPAIFYSLEVPCVILHHVTKLCKGLLFPMKKLTLSANLSASSILPFCKSIFPTIKAYAKETN